MAPQASRAARRFGYVVSALLVVAIWAGLHTWPGWDVLPFLAPEFADLLPLVDLSLLVSATANLLYVVSDATRFKALVDLVVSVVGIVPMAAMWQRWPFTVDQVWSGWGLVVHLLLVVGIVGSAVSALVDVARLVDGPPAVGARPR